MEPLDPQRWRELVRPGSRIFLSSGASCPHALVESLLAADGSLTDVEFLHLLTLGPAPWTDSAYAQQFRVNALFLSPQTGALVNAGIDDYTPIHLSDVPALMHDGTLAPDVALISVSPPDRFGYCSLGTSVDVTRAACACADRVIAQVNPHLPRTHGQSFLHRSEIDYFLEATAHLPTLEVAAPNAVHRQIGEYVASLVENGATLHLDTSPLGAAILGALHRHRHLGLHTEALTDGMQRALEAGVIDNSRKIAQQGKSVCASAVGSTELYDFCDNNPHLEFRPTEYVNNPLIIARNPRMAAIVTALQVDLTGQVVFDSLNGVFTAGLGGHLDFLRGAAMCDGGLPLIALPSLADDGVSSRLCATLGPGTGVGYTRADVHYVVTEYGIATLRGRSIRERVLELVQVAHPTTREDLLRAAREAKLVPGYLSLPSQPVDEIGGVQIRRLKLSDDITYTLRPLTPADERRLQEFFYSHTDETIHQRYGFMVRRMSRERAYELVGVDQRRDLALAFFEVQGPRQQIHAVGRYYLDHDGKGGEMAFVVRENKRRLGMARRLLEVMVEVARKRGLTHLWAQVDRDNMGMLKLFSDYGATSGPGEEARTVRVTLPLTTAAATAPEES